MTRAPRVDRSEQGASDATRARPAVSRSLEGHVEVTAETRELPVPTWREHRDSACPAPAASFRTDQLLALQRTVGNAAIVRWGRIVSAGSGGVVAAPAVQRALSADDQTALAAQLHESMAGWGTDEEAIFSALQKLKKSAADATALKAAYQAAYSTSLEDDLRSEMSGSELALALELLGSGGSAVGGPPAGAADIEATVTRLKAAFGGWGTDEEEVYACLIPFGRDAAKLATLRTTYTTKTGNDLEDDIKDEMSSDELAYALYLLNAPAPLPPTADVAVTSPGAEQHAGALEGGKTSVRTGVDFNVGATAYPGGFSVGYEGGLADDSGWVQFLWSEIVATQADGSETYVAQGGLPTTNGTMELTTDPSDPKRVVDSASADSPFYESGGVDIRTPTSTTLYDRPSEFSDIMKDQFDLGATKAVERDHFDQFLVRDYKTIYHTSVTVQWVYTSKVAITRTTTAGAGGKVTEMPKAFRSALVAQYPRSSYIQ
jgi:hypothetical protein